jgi:hypothetical protein
MSKQILSKLEERWPLFAVLAAVVVGTRLVQVLYTRSLLWRLPVLAGDRLDEKSRRDQFITGARGLYTEAYKTFSDGICRMTTTKGL